MARPHKHKVDVEQLEKLAAMQCTTKEIAAFFNCSEDTIQRRYAAVVKKGRELGTAKLRRLQWQAAERGNVVMMIWLGKQLLGQKDKAHLEMEGALDTIPRVVIELPAKDPPPLSLIEPAEEAEIGEPNK